MNYTSEMILRLHNDLKSFPKISPILLMRKTKHTLEFCLYLYDKILQMRKDEGIERKKWSRIK